MPMFMFFSFPNKRASQGPTVLLFTATKLGHPEPYISRSKATNKGLTVTATLSHCPTLAFMHQECNQFYKILHMLVGKSRTEVILVPLFTATKLGHPEHPYISCSRRNKQRIDPHCNLVPPPDISRHYFMHPELILMASLAAV